MVFGWKQIIVYFSVLKNLQKNKKLVHNGKKQHKMNWKKNSKITKVTTKKNNKTKNKTKQQ